MSVFHACMSWVVSNERLSNISVFGYVHVDFPSLKSLLITSFYVFLGLPQMKLLLTLKVLCLLDRALCPFLFR